jgi:hypothetical protein
VPPAIHGAHHVQGSVTVLENERHRAALAAVARQLDRPRMLQARASPPRGRAAASASRARDLPRYPDRGVQFGHRPAQSGRQAVIDELRGGVECRPRLQHPRGGLVKPGLGHAPDCAGRHRHGARTLAFQLLKGSRIAAPVAPDRATETAWLMWISGRAGPHDGEARRAQGNGRGGRPWLRLC